MAGNEITRRQGLGLALVAARVAAAPSLAARPKIDSVCKIDFKNPQWNRDTFAWMAPPQSPAMPNLRKH